LLAKKLLNVRVTVNDASFGCRGYPRPRQTRIARHCEQRSDADWRRCFVAMMPAAEFDTCVGHFLSIFGLEHLLRR
jgi:hypothetical protein